jgi:hypothetical protein
MTQEGVGQDDFKDSISRASYSFVALWAAGLLLLYAIGGYIGVRMLQGYRAETEKSREALIKSQTIEPGTKAPEIRVSKKPVEVHVGIYINRIGEFDAREGGWTANFDIWFRWTDARIRPGETFQLVNGEVIQREKRETYTRGGERYERYQVKARITKYFDPSRFPFSDEGLSIWVEDGARGEEKLRYVAEDGGSGIRPLGIPQHLAITKTLATVKYYSRESTRDDPRISPGTPEVHSCFIFAMLFKLPSFPIYLRNFQALFASVAIAFIVFFIRPIHVDPRFGLGIGAFFAAIANNISVGTSLPPIHHFTLTAMVNALGLATIFLTLVQSAISLYIEDTMGREKLHRLFDKVSFTVFLIGYTATNLLLPLAAKS